MVSYVLSAAAATFVTLVFLLYRSNHNMLQSVKFVVKSVVYGSLISVIGCYGVGSSIVLRLVGKKDYAQTHIGRIFYFFVSKFLGLKITIRNGERLKGLPAVIVSNHQSALDVYMLGLVFQTGYTVTAKKVLKYFPFLGWFMTALGTFFLDRSKGEKARKVLELALLDLKKDKRGLFIFPEGTRSGLEELELLPFKKGAFHLAKQAGIPVIPVVVSNTSTIFNSKNKYFNTGEIFIDVLEPMPTIGLETNEDVTKFTEEIHEKMSVAYKKLGYSKTIEPVSKFISEQAKKIAAVEGSDDSTDTNVEVITVQADEETPLVKSK